MPEDYRLRHKIMHFQARQFRRELTPAEQRLWTALRRRQTGHSFRRQHAIDHFIADFYCPAAHLIVEVDGVVHDSQAERDEARTQWLEARGYRVMRFSNADVLDRIDAVVLEIKRVIELEE